MKFRTTSPRRFAVALTGAAIGVAAVTTISSGPSLAQVDIPDAGLPAVPLAESPVVSPVTEPLAAGVVGYNYDNDLFPQLNANVLAFAEIGNIIYVGGKFTAVQYADGTTAPQPFLAAFFRDTGRHVASFAPALDGNVWSLAVTPDGQLLVGGQFSQTIVKMDPASGAIDDSWDADLALTGADRRPLVRAIELDGDQVYLGGNFTRIGPDANPVANAARVSLTDATPDLAWRPNVDGVVFDIEATPGRVYVAGNIINVNDEFSIGLAVLSDTDASLVPGITPWERTAPGNSANSYIHDVLPLGDRVWHAGAEKQTQLYNADDYSLIESWVADPFGDGQALTTDGNGVVYAGSHANPETSLYQGAVRWPELTDLAGNAVTDATPTRWVAAFDNAAVDQLPWRPDMLSENGEGAWALHVDSTDCLWAGGDFLAGSEVDGQRRFAAGFVKFCPLDTTPPGAPGGLQAEATAGGIQLTWASGTGDNRPGQLTYEVLRDGTSMATGLTGTEYLDADGQPGDRYFVRTFDVAGNASATTRVAVAAPAATTTTAVSTTNAPEVETTTTTTTVAGPTSTEAPTTTAAPATTEAPATSEAPATTEPPASGGDSSTEQPTDDDVAPNVPKLFEVQQLASGDVQANWVKPGDNVGVTGYVVYRNGVEIDRTADTSALLPPPAEGGNFYQVTAVDAAGNESARTAPLEIYIEPVPVAPYAPREFEAQVTARGTVILTWVAPPFGDRPDDYVVLLNLPGQGPDKTIVFTTDETSIELDLRDGPQWLQVRGRNAAGEGTKTAPIRVDFNPEATG